MSFKHNVLMGMALTVTLFSAQMVDAARRGKEEKAPLTEKGEELKAQYAAEIASRKAEILSKIPKFDAKAVQAYENAVEAETQAKASLAEAKEAFGQIAKAHGLVNHAKGKWIGGAEKAIQKAKDSIASAKTDEEREKAKADLAAAEKNLLAGQQALKERQALLDQALKDEAKLTKAVEDAEAKLAEARQNVFKAVAALGFNDFLMDDKLDGELAKFMVLQNGTPSGLAAFAQQGDKEKKLIDALLADEELMIKMEIADGANGGNYGRAMEIYTAIQDASRKARKGELQRLALGIALEHAVPRPQRNAKAEEDAPRYVDPVKRYLNYEKAYLAGELDPGFKTFSPWEYRMAVNGEEPDHIAAWGREMLRSYRPDHVTNPDERWRYGGAVRTEIRYGSQYNKYDKNDLQFFQNILMNGGICGRRAFFGRFILRSFGIPTVARPQPGHAALARWTPDGWVINLGAGWGKGHTKGIYGKDLNFLATTQAREDEKRFMKVKRAQWLGSVLGEKPVYGFVGIKENPEFWYGVSLYVQKNIIEELEAEALAAVGEELGEANESDVEYTTDEATLTDVDREITVDKNGVITIPAAATTKPTQSTKKIIFMNSNLGGKQLHYSRTGKAEEFVYEVTVPEAGTYNLTARVAVPSWGQVLLAQVNDAKESVVIDLPLTTGLWGTVEPVQVSLKKGKNTITFARGGDDPNHIRGLSIRDFTLTPMK